MQRTAGKTVFLQGFFQQGHGGLAIGEYDAVLDVIGMRAHQVAQCIAFRRVIGRYINCPLGYGFCGG